MRELRRAEDIDDRKRERMKRDWKFEVDVDVDAYKKVLETKCQ